MIHILLKYILLCEFSSDLDAQSDFDKKVVTKKTVKQNHSYLKYALVNALIGEPLKRRNVDFVVVYRESLHLNYVIDQFELKGTKKRKRSLISWSKAAFNNVLLDVIKKLFTA